MVLATRTAGRLLPPEARRRLLPLVAGRATAVAGLAVTPVAAAHDGAGAVSLRLDASEGAVGIAIDLGSYGAPTLDLLRGCRVLVVEANHCPRLLAHGPYPGYLKRRVAGPLGHLSNGQCRALLEEVVHDGLERVLLAHLSAVNNRPEAIWAELDELQRAFPAGAFLLGSREDSLPPLDVGASSRPLPPGDDLAPGRRTRGGPRGQMALPF